MVCVEVFHDESLDAVVQFANDTEYGLQAKAGAATSSQAGVARWANAMENYTATKSVTARL